MSFALLPLPHGCSRVCLGHFTPLRCVQPPCIHPQPELRRACWPPTDRGSQDDLLKGKAVSREPLTAGRVRSLPFSRQAVGGTRRRPAIQRTKRPAAQKSPPTPDQGGLFRPQCRDRSPKAGYVQTKKTTKKMSKVRRVPTRPARRQKASPQGYLPTRRTAAP